MKTFGPNVQMRQDEKDAVVEGSFKSDGLYKWWCWHQTQKR